MKKAEKEKLKSNGWKVGSASGFLNLSSQEAAKLAKMVKAVTKKNIHPEFDWDKPVGREKKRRK